MKDEALKMCVEALTVAHTAEVVAKVRGNTAVMKITSDALAAARAALAEQPAPVAWLYRGGGQQPIRPDDDWKLHMGPEAPHLAWRYQEKFPVYGAALAAQPDAPSDYADVERVTEGEQNE